MSFRTDTHGMLHFFTADLVTSYLLKTGLVYSATCHMRDLMFLLVYSMGQKMYWYINKRCRDKKKFRNKK